MNKQRKVLITITYNELGIIVDTKAEELGSSAQPEIIRCGDCMHNGSFDTDCPIYWPGKKFCNFGERKDDE